jgi:hypothetical protein
MARRRSNKRDTRPALKLTKKRTPVRAPRTAAQFDAKPEKFKDTWDRVVSVISRMRSEKKSLQRTAKEHGVSPRTVKRWASSALQKTSGGKWAAKKSDSLLRVLTIPTPDGTRELGVRGSREATRLAEYWNAVRYYLATGDASQLAKFEGKCVKDANGDKIPFITDRRELNRQGSAGILSFESLYSRSA